MASKGGKEDKKSIQKVFKEFDKDNDGFINKKELKQLLAKWNVNVTNEELDDMMNDIDTNKDGKIDLNEFQEFMDKGGLDSAATLKQTFKLFDADGDGYITEAELTQTLNSVASGSNLSKEQIKKIFSDADTDKDGKISFKEFKAYMEKTFGEKGAEEEKKDES